jgi:hypothetical protein
LQASKNGPCDADTQLVNSTQVKSYSNGNHHARPLARVIMYAMMIYDDAMSKSEQPSERQLNSFPTRTLRHSVLVKVSEVSMYTIFLSSFGSLILTCLVASRKLKLLGVAHDN